MIRNECPLIDDDDGGSINGFRPQKRQIFFLTRFGGNLKIEGAIIASWKNQKFENRCSSRPND